MKRFALASFALFACSMQEDGPMQSAVTAIGDVMNVEVEVLACNSILERVVELDVAAAGDELEVAQLTIQDSPVGNGDLVPAARVTVPPDHAFRIPDAEALEIVFGLMREEGLSLGGSSGFSTTRTSRSPANSATPNARASGTCFIRMPASASDAPNACTCETMPRVRKLSPRNATNGASPIASRASPIACAMPPGVACST